MGPPRYPDEAARSGVAGTVYLLVRVGRDGKVEDVVAEQTNLKVVAKERDMNAFRGMLERASVAAARRWMFAPPKAGPGANEDHWVVRVPVDYRLRHRETEVRHLGILYPRSARHRALGRPRQMLAGADAMSDGALYQLGTGLQLLTPLGPG